MKREIRETNFCQKKKLSTFILNETKCKTKWKPVTKYVV